VSSIRISKATVDAAKPEQRDAFFWDEQLKGFGLKVTPKGKKVYVCQYRVGGGASGASRRQTIGAHGILTPDEARSTAKQILGMAANGSDPALEKQSRRKQITVAELCDRYLAEGCGTKKASTLDTDRGRIERHIKPLLGRKKVPDVTRADIKRFLQDVAEGKTAIDVRTRKYGRARVSGGRGTASRTVGLLGGIFSFARDLELIGSNPVQGVKRFADKRSTRFLSEAELVSLGDALRAVSSGGANPSGIAVIRLLIFTGARKSEIEALQWSEVCFDQALLRLADSKTGQKTLLLNPGALSVLSELQCIDGSDFVFPASKGLGHYVGTPKVWGKVRNMAGLQNVRIHDLRHSFASVAVSMGASLPIIGALLGHRDAATTQRYAHLQDDPVRSATNAVAARIETHLGAGAMAQ
jgi:integrase